MSGGCILGSLAEYEASQVNIASSGVSEAASYAMSAYPMTVQLQESGCGAL